MTKTTPSLDAQESPASMPAPSSSAPGDPPPVGALDGAPSNDAFSVTGLLVVVLCCAAAYGAFQLYGAGPEASQVGEYFTLAASAGLPAIVDTIDDGVRRRCDPQLLAMLIKSVPGRYGLFQSARSEGFRSSDEVANGARRREYDGVMVFERGEVPLKIGFVGDKLVTFMIRNEVIAQGLLASRGLPPDLTPYEDLGERFWRAAVSNEPDVAFVMMSEPLQKSIGRPGFAAQCQELAVNGAIKSLTFLRAVPHAQHRDRVHLLYRVTAERGSSVCHVTFQFGELSSYLIAFQIPSTYAASDVVPAVVPAPSTGR